VVSSSTDTKPASEAPSRPAAQVVAPAPPRRNLTEATTVARAQDGDAAAFEQLVRSYQAELFRLGYRMLSDRGDAEDAVQDCLVLAWRRLPTLVDPQTFRAWIYQLMTRRCLSVLRLRARRRTDVGAGTDLATDGPAGTPVGAGTTVAPAAQVQADAVSDGLTAALNTLSADQRACWVLHEMHDLSYPAIAYAIGVPVSTVRGRIARARLQLAKGMTAWR